MKQIHFIHTSDWHIGFMQYNKTERYLDFFKAADDVVKKIIKIKPMFVLHTGDIFHNARPSPGTIRQVVRILNRLKKENIPLFIIRGNHDGKSAKILESGGNTISLLRELKLVNYIDDEIMTEEYHGISGVSILGVGFYPGNILNEKIETLLRNSPDFLSNNDYKIIAFHAYVQGQLADFHHISINQVSKLGVDYIAAGHYHIPWKNEKLKLFAPGSTETTSTNEWRRMDLKENICMYSSFYEIKSEYQDKWKNPQIIQHQVLVRPKAMLSLETDTIENLRQSIINELLDKKKIIAKYEPSLLKHNPMALVNILYSKNQDDLRMVDLSGLEKETGYLHININMLGEKDRIIISADTLKNQDIEEILRDISGLPEEELDDFLNESMTLLQIFRDIPISRDMNTELFTEITNILSSIDATNSGDDQPKIISFNNSPLKKEIQNDKDQMVEKKDNNLTKNKLEDYF
ncbi:MAG: DNA repair exonuclease [Candidatus Heimdallarchaeota archaeon]|nr:DNA repair exonuclease [Candidatus Heimdallarchaeota archaeon]MDH5644544.1 DNA repair exonuclease [Candidatus Heimdallarchaeota archaeon]